MNKKVLLLGLIAFVCVVVCGEDSAVCDGSGSSLIEVRAAPKSFDKRIAQLLHLLPSVEPTLLHTFNNHFFKRDGIFCTPALSLDGRFIALSSLCFFTSNGKDLYDVHINDTKTGKTVSILKGHTNYISSIAFNDDGKLLVSFSHDNTIRVWDVQTGACLRILAPRPGNDPGEVRFNKDGTRIITWAGYSIGIENSASCDYKVGGGGGWGAGRDGMCNVSYSYKNNSLKIWDSEAECFLQNVTIDDDHYGGPLRYAVSDDHNYFACVTEKKDRSYRYLLRIWDTRTGNCIRKFYTYRGQVPIVKLSHDNSKVLVGVRYSDDNPTRIRLWSVETGKCIADNEVRSGLRSIDFNYNDTLIVCGTYSVIYIYDVATGVCLYTLNGSGSVSSYMDDVVLSADGTRIVERRERVVYLWKAPYTLAGLYEAGKIDLTIEQAYLIVNLFTTETTTAGRNNYIKTYTQAFSTLSQGVKNVLEDLGVVV